VPPFEETREYVRRVLGLYRQQEVALPPAAAGPPGRRVTVTRDAAGRLVVTTDGAGGS